MAAKDEVMPEETKSAWPDHFRYIDEISPEGVTIVCKRFVVIRESEHCYWIVPQFYEYVALEHLKRGAMPKYAKRVLKVSGRRFAYPEKSHALHSYKVRKRRQMGHAQLAIERAKAALEDLKGVDTINDEHLCSGGDYIKELTWDC